MTPALLIALAVRYLRSAGPPRSLATPSRPHLTAREEEPWTSDSPTATPESLTPNAMVNVLGARPRSTATVDAACAGAVIAPAVTTATASAALNLRVTPFPQVFSAERRHSR